MALDPHLTRKFVDVVSGEGDAVQQPLGVVPYPQTHIGTVQSNDYVNAVTLCTLKGGTTKVPVAVPNGRYPSVNSLVLVVQVGQSYFLQGVMGLGYLDPISARVYRSNATGWTPNTTANAPLVWDTKTGAGAWDPSGAYSTSTGKFTCPVPGRYRVESLLGFTDTANEYLQLSILQNGTAVSYGTLTPPFASVLYGGSGYVSDLITCAAGDELQIGQNNASATMTYNTGPTAHAFFVLQ